VAIGNGIGVPFRRGGGGGAIVSPDFVIEVDTTQAGSASDTIILALTSSGTFDGTIDWGDSSTSDLTYANREHTYASGGTYTITISGDTFEGWRVNNGGDKLKFIDVQNWGFFTFIQTTRHFYGCSNLDISATDAPIVATTTFQDTFRTCSALTSCDFDSWDVSGVTTFQGMFYQATNFNGAMGNWDTSSSTNFVQMFFATRYFNSYIGDWDMSSALSTGYMFYDARAFNQDIGSWDVSSVTYFNGMFRAAWAFNQNIDSWDTSSATTMTFMFYQANAYNQPVNSWDVSNVTDMKYMLTSAPFNQPLSNWNTSSVVNMSYMFQSNNTFDQDISNFDVNQVSNLDNFGTGLTLSTANYDALLIAWDAQGVMSFSGTVNFGGSKYTSGGAAETARTSLITKWGGITDGGAA